MAGWSVLTWPPAMDSAPVSSETERTSTFSEARNSRVPSVAKTSTPRLSRLRANGAMPSRLATESRARTRHTSRLSERPGYSKPHLPAAYGGLRVERQRRRPAVPDGPEYTVRAWHTPLDSAAGHQARPTSAALTSSPLLPLSWIAVHRRTGANDRCSRQFRVAPMGGVQPHEFLADLRRHVGAGSRPAGPFDRSVQLPGPAFAQLLGLPRPERVAPVDLDRRLRRDRDVRPLPVRLHLRPALHGRRRGALHLGAFHPFPAPDRCLRTAPRPPALLPADPRLSSRDHDPCQGSAEEQARPPLAATGASRLAPRRKLAPTMDIRRFGIGHRPQEGPAGTHGVSGQPIHGDDRGAIEELAFRPHGAIAPHENPNLAYFVVIEGGGFVQVGEEVVRVARSEERRVGEE